MSIETDNIERLMKNKGASFRRFDVETHVETETRDGQTVEKLIIEGEPVVFESTTTLFESGGVRCCEVIDARALDDCDMTDVIFNYNHGGRVYARTRNGSLSLDKTETGIHMRAELWPDDEGHKELYRDIKRGNLDKMSFCFTVDGDEFDERKEDGVKIMTRRITHINKLYDVSVVDLPAYDETSISARRAFDAESERREAESRRAESRARARKYKIMLYRRELETCQKKRSGK